MQRALSRQESKELTRRRLIDGAIELLRTDGVAGATTARIARAAGIKQSSFYGHFADRNACLQAAAEVIGNRVLARVRERQASIDVGSLRSTVRRSLADVVEAFVAEPSLTRIFLRHRSDDESPLGRTFRSLIDRAHVDLRKDVRLIGIARTSAQAEAHAELLVAGTLGLVEGVLDQRVSDREAALDAMTDVVCAAVKAALSRKDGSE